MSHFIVAAAAAATTTFALMDCNPSLWVYSLWARPVTKQRVWILGASSGIGKELALQLAPNNDLILSSRNIKKLEDVAKACRQTQTTNSVKLYALDVTDNAALLEASESIECDICILNAGIGHLSLASATSPATATAMLHSNALWQMIIAPNLKCRHIVVMSSIAGILPVPLSAAYAASKHALQGYFKSLKAERSDLLIDLVCPGPVDTDFHSTSSETTTEGDAHRTPSPLKMSSERCAKLTLATISRTHFSNYGSTVWICPQPTLTALYLERLLPDFLFDKVMQRIGKKRVDLFTKGYDLYDPKSWRK